MYFIHLKNVQVYGYKLVEHIQNLKLTIVDEMVSVQTPEMNSIQHSFSQKLTVVLGELQMDGSDHI